MGRLAQVSGWRWRAIAVRGAPLACLIASASLIGSVAPVLAQRAVRKEARTRSGGCRVPDVRGYTLGYARELIHGSRCALGKVKPQGRATHGLVVLAESPRPGTSTRVGARVSLRLGHRSRGCRALHFHVLTHTAGLYLWTEVLGNPDGADDEREPSGSQLEACAPPAGPVVTVWSQSEVGSEEQSGFGGLETAGEALAFLETQSDQNGTSQYLVAFDLERSSAALGCTTSTGHEHCLLRELVSAAGPPPAGAFAGSFPVGLAGYAIDAAGDVAWLQSYGSATRALYVLTSSAKAAIKVEEGALGAVALKGGNLTWTVGGQPRSEAIAEIL